MAIAKGLHLHDPALPYRVDVCQPYLLPLAAVSGAEMSIDKHHDPIAGSNESFRLAASFSPSGSRLHQIFFDLGATVVRTAARKCRRLAPFDLRIK